MEALGLAFLSIYGLIRAWSLVRGLVGGSL
jgi:hypothetical protein